MNNLTVKIAQPAIVNTTLSSGGVLYAKSLDYTDFIFSSGAEIANAIVKRDSAGLANFTTARAVAGAAAIYATSTGGNGTYAIDVRGTNGSSGIAARSVSATAAEIISTGGTYHATFGDSGIDRAFVARDKGAFGWIRNNGRTARIYPPDTIGADRTYTLPDASGVILLDSAAANFVDRSSNQTIDGVKTFNTSPRVPNLTFDSSSTSVVNKAYADNIATGIHVHAEAHVILKSATLAVATGGTVAYTNGNNGVGAKLTVSGGSTVIDGLNAVCGVDPDLTSGVNGSRVVIAGETNTAHNGVYTISAPRELTRAVDADSPAKMNGGDFIFVTHGTLFANTSWIVSDPVTTVGTSPVVFLQFSGAGAYDVGTGLTRDGTIFSITNTGVNSTSTTYGSGTSIPVLTVNPQGQITAATTAAVTADASKANLSGATFTGTIGATNLSGTNTGDETAATIKSKLAITTLSGSNTGDQNLSGLVPYIGASQAVNLGNNNLTAGTVNASSFVKTGGTASQFLKADGSVDTNSYLTSETDSQTLTWNSGTGNISISNGNTISLDGRYLRTESDTLDSVSARGATTTQTLTVGNLTTGGTVSASNLVYNSGNQAIDGVKNFTSAPTINGNRVATLVDPVRTTLTGNGSSSSFAIGGAAGLTNPSALIVAIDGALQEPGIDYTVGGGNITFTDVLPNGAKAVVIAPTNSLQVGVLTPSDGSVTSAKLAPNLTLGGTTSFGDTRPTSTATGTPAVNSLMTRTDGDARYGEIIVSRLSADAAAIQSQTVFQDTGCSVALTAGVWEITAQTHITNANVAAQAKFVAVVSGGSSSQEFGRVMWGVGNVGVPGHDNIFWLTGPRALGNGARGWWAADGLVVVNSGTVNIRTQYAQNVSTAADTVVKANSFLIARRVSF